MQQFRGIKKFIQNPVVGWSYHKTKIPGRNCMNYHHLSIEERSCIRKYYVDGLSYREIARLPAGSRTPMSAVYAVGLADGEIKI